MSVVNMSPRVNPFVFEAAMLLEAGYVINGLPNMGYKDWEWYGKGSIQIGFVRREEVRYIVLPGTNELADWKANLSFMPTKIYGVKGYWRKGFAEGADVVANEIWSRVDVEEKLVIVGHSYGAALAFCTAAIILGEMASKTVKAIIGFGTPRFCSAAGVKELESAYGDKGQRIIMGSDVVPWLVLPVGWRHAFEPVFITEGGLKGKLDFWGECWRSLKTWKVEALEDHGIGKYADWARGL